jgi:hypothetical protein
MSGLLKQQLLSAYRKNFKVDYNLNSVEINYYYKLLSKYYVSLRLQANFLKSSIRSIQRPPSTPLFTIHNESATTILSPFNLR